MRECLLSHSVAGMEIEATDKPGAVRVGEIAVMAGPGLGRADRRTK
jgi:hypothetical protein